MAKESSVVTIYHNPNCSTSKKVLGWLKEKGIEPKVVEYLKTPLDEAGLKSLLKKLKLGPRDILRKKGEAFEALKLTDKTTDEALIKAMGQDPGPDRAADRGRAEGRRPCPPAGTGLGGGLINLHFRLKQAD